MSRSSIIIALVAFGFGTSVAQAQLPNLRRKAKEAARAATGQTDQRKPPPTFDNTILELNPQVVGRLIAGLEARSSARGAGGLTAAEMRHRGSAAADEAANLNNQHSDDRAKWAEANDAAESCMSNQLSNVEQRHAQQMQQRFVGMTGVNTPEKTKFMQDYATGMQEMQQAAASGDTVGLRRAQVKLNKLFGIDAHADTVNARATCQVPPVPAWMRRADSLAALGDTLTARARGAEVTGNAAAARTAEMTPAQFAMAAERAEAFVALQRPGNVGGGYVFTPLEEQALTARLVDLKKYLG